jgi:2-isopropylmalate synthase
MIKIERDGKRWNGRGVSNGIVESSIKAYVAAINTMDCP